MSKVLPLRININETPNCIIRIEKSIYCGCGFIDIRRYYKNKLGDIIPTRKGIVIPPDKVNDVSTALQTIIFKS